MPSPNAVRAAFAILVALPTHLGATPPVPSPPSDGITLDAMLAHADAHSPVILVAESTRSRAEAARVAASPLLPGNTELTVALGPRIGPNGSALDADVSLMQQIGVAGERRQRRAAAERLADLTDAEIARIRWNVRCDVHAAFQRALVERGRAELARRVVAFQEQVLRAVERRIAAGEDSSLSLRLAEAELAQAQQVLVLAEQGFLASRIRLGMLSGWSASEPPQPSGALDAPTEPPAQDDLVALARENLPSLRFGAAAVLEAEARATAADRARAPRPSMGVQYERESNPSPDTPYHIVMGVFSVPITGFQRNQGERAQARADVIVAEAELEAMRVLLAGRISEARSEVVAAGRRTRAYGSEIVPRFEENLGLLQRAFDAGDIDVLALSAGRERFLRIQGDALSAQLDYWTAVAALERVVGVALGNNRADAPRGP